MVRNTVERARFHGRRGRAVPLHRLLHLRVLPGVAVAFFFAAVSILCHAGPAAAFVVAGGGVLRRSTNHHSPVAGMPCLVRERIRWGGRIGSLGLSNAESPSPEPNDKANNDKNDEEEELVVPAMIPREELLIGDDFASAPSSSSSGVDWDAEWKKVVRQQKQSGGITPNTPVDRPGKNYYKSEAEIAAIKAANRATKGVRQAASQLPSLPSWKSLQGDWKFWIGVLLAISFGASLLTATAPPSQPTSISSPDSYFI